MAPTRVCANSRPTAVAGAIAGIARDLAEGANAARPIVKSSTIARRYLSTNALDVGCVPYMVDTVIDVQIRAAVTLRIITR